ncbi:MULTISPECIES: group II intron reverse transcriptase/maturase [Bacillus cereus group]|uniref:group II intron reverse transcriptase/maturase n=1 Tax=Bacillus cereus group TaxID=86661 RepID=UPI000D9F5511|nr:group II intron reverse transcriptase/maturase [Bacillus cereus]MCU4946782.1 group II intron reverse transcriptase/maturase [Bacillus cereus]SPT76222.1 group II intron reverse transcriptase/maturase [Bacillus cereus]
MKKFNKEGLKDKSLRHSEYYGMQELQDEIYAKSLNGGNFKQLMKVITSDSNILLAFRNIKRNSGSITEGIDGVTIKDIEKISQEDFIKIVQKRFSNYTPRKVRRVEIPKPNGKMRPLGIPSMWDRIAQQCIKQVLEPICEAKFNKHSHGFRPNRSPETAMADATFRINRSHMQYVVDVDIRGFFDEVNHNKLMRQLWTMGIRDKQLLVIIRKMLKAPIVLPNGEIQYPSKGTPQGGILSPLLANINLNEFDWWIANQWEERLLKELSLTIKKDGHLDKYPHYSKMRKKTALKEMYIVRYADDFKIFTTTKVNAGKIFKACKMWLQERLKLPISKEKSKITNLRKESSEFLGFEIKMVKKGNKLIARTHISNKAKKKIQKQFENQIAVIQRSKNEELRNKAIIRYNSMVIGTHNYYEIATEVNEDLAIIHRHLNIRLYNRLHVSRKGNYKGRDKGTKRYMKSKMVRYLNDIPILPLAYIKHKSPKNKDTKINKYTPQGRKLIHKNQSAVPEWKIQWLREHPVISQRATVEYNDNRISLFVAQNGKCAITSEELILSDMQCHHKTLWKYTQDDSYKNLILICSDVHRLIHATTPDVISGLMEKLKLNEEQLIKLNKLRKQAKNETLEIN